MTELPAARTPIQPSRAQENLSDDRLLAVHPKDELGRPLIGGIPLHGRLGKGGMGAVYYGVHPRLNVEVAVKILPFTLAEQEPTLIKRFQSEARIAAAIANEHVVRVIDVDIDAGTHFLVMEHVPGDSAGGLLKRGGPMTEGEALEIVIAATKGLAAAHAKSIIHRDIKPDNVLIPGGRGSRAKLADLGLAKPEGGGQSVGTASHVAMGTPGFMSPEQIEDAKTAGPAADVFSMGATLYALLSGRAPFVGTSLGVILRDTATVEPPPLPPSVSARTRAIVAKCMAKGAAQRFPNAAALLEALQGKGEVTAPTAPTLLPPTLVPAGPTPWRKAFAATWMAAHVVIVLLAFYGEGRYRAASSLGIPMPAFSQMTFRLLAILSSFWWMLLAPMAGGAAVILLGKADRFAKLGTIVAGVGTVLAVLAANFAITFPLNNVPPAE